jgi:hypothetical protein
MEDASRHARSLMRLFADFQRATTEPTEPAGVPVIIGVDSLGISMYSLLYVSSAATAFSAEDLRALLKLARENNTRLDVTGMLLYKDGNFMQLLEGEESAVQGLYDKIVRDPRHKGALTLLKGNVEERSFGQWSMGFRELKSATDSGVPGYNDFLNTPLTSGDFVSHPSKAQKLLLMFKEKM